MTTRPRDVLVDIWSFLRRSEVVRTVSCVCPRWKAIANETSVSHVVILSPEAHLHTPFVRTVERCTATKWTPMEDDIDRGVVSMRCRRDEREVLDAVRVVRRWTRRVCSFEFLGFRTSDALKEAISMIKSLFGNDPPSGVVFGFCPGVDDDVVKIYVATLRPTRLHVEGCGRFRGENLSSKVSGIKYLHVDSTSFTTVALKKILAIAKTLVYVSARYTPALNDLVELCSPRFHTDIFQMNRPFRSTVDDLAQRVALTTFSHAQNVLWKTNYELYVGPTRDFSNAAKALLIDTYYHNGDSEPVSLYNLSILNDRLEITNDWMRDLFDFPSKRPLEYYATAGTTYGGVHENSLRFSSLHCACQTKNIELVNYLMSKNWSNPLYRCFSSEDSICISIVSRDVVHPHQWLSTIRNIVNYARAHAPSVHFQQSQFRLGWTYLHFVAQEMFGEDGREMVRLFVRTGCDVSTRDYDGTTALMVAAAATNVHVLEELLDHTVKSPESTLNEPDDEGTLLYHAVSGGCTRCVELVLQHLQHHTFSVRIQRPMALALTLSNRTKERERRKIVQMLILFEDCVLLKKSLDTAKARKRRRHR